MLTLVSKFGKLRAPTGLGARGIEFLRRILKIARRPRLVIGMVFLLLFSAEELYTGGGFLHYSTFFLSRQLILGLAATFGTIFTVAAVPLVVNNPRASGVLILSTGIITLSVLPYSITTALLSAIAPIALGATLTTHGRWRLPQSVSSRTWALPTIGLGSLALPWVSIYKESYQPGFITGPEADHWILTQLTLSLSFIQVIPPVIISLVVLGSGLFAVTRRISRNVDHASSFILSTSGWLLVIALETFILVMIVAITPIAIAGSRYGFAAGFLSIGPWLALAAGLGMIRFAHGFDASTRKTANAQTAKPIVPETVDPA